jgi:uncharacterized protein DUF1501
MDPTQEHVRQTRRGFLTSAASGLGLLGLASLLQEEGALAAPDEGGLRRSAIEDPLTLRPPHFAPRAKSCIFLFLAGGTSQIELFDPKPELVRMSGQALPESFTKDVRFSFIKPGQSVLMGSRHAFRRYGQCGMEISELLPHVGSCADDIALIRSMHTGAFDHAPAEVEMSTGIDVPGRPSAGAWLTYGLGTESKNLPGYVVLLVGRGPTARAMAWGSGFLPSVHSGVVFRNQGEPVLNLESPPGVTPEVQRGELDALGKLNRLRYGQVRDPEIAARIAAYELAFRMQAAAPDLIDLSRESKQTLDAYGVGRPGEGGSFSTNCLLARRLVERGVRCVSIFHRNWDHHKDLDRDLAARCADVDRPIGALLKDLKQRGLLDSTLVVWGTEFGRTPLTENAQPGPGAGRDHHPFAFSMWMAGGGVKGGQVIGATDELSWKAVEDPVHIHDFHATLLHLFGIDHRKLTYRFKGHDFRLTDVAGKVVTRLLA